MQIWCKHQRAESKVSEKLLTNEQMLPPMRDARSKLAQYKISSGIYFTPARLHTIATIEYLLEM